MELATKRELSGIGYMLAAAFLFSVMIVTSKVASQGLHPMEVVFVRGLFVIAAICPGLLRRGESLLGSKPRTLFLRSIFGFTAVCLLFHALVEIRAADATVLNLTSVLFTAVLAIPILGEQLTTRRALYTVLGFFGVLMILKPSLTSINRHALLGLASGIVSAFAYLTIRSLKGAESSSLVVFHFGAYCAGLSLVFFGSAFIVPNLQQSLLLLLTAATGCYGQLALTEAYARAPASRVAPFLYTEVPLVALWAFIFTGEVPDLFSIIGGALIITAGIGIVREKPYRPEP